MKKLIAYLLVVVLTSCLFICGCESHDDDYYDDYDDQSYVTVVVRNDYWADIDIIVGNAFFDRVQSGETRWVNRNLIGDEGFSITILFWNYYGSPIAQSVPIWFDREYSEYHLNVRSPGDIQKY